jgi:anti-anti-sigma factor
VTAFSATWHPDGVLYLAGELDLASETAVVAALRERPDTISDLVIDLSALTFLDSTGIRVLETIATGPTAIHVVLRSPGRAVLRVLELVGIPDWPNATISAEEAHVSLA